LGYRAVLAALMVALAAAAWRAACHRNLGQDS